MIRAFIFDLDGTLVDTLGDIATVMNGFLKTKSWPGHSVEAYRMMVGRGLATLIRAAVPPEQADFADDLYEEVFSVYQAMGVGDSRPYPGTIETLGELAARGAKLAVVSNKPDAITRNMVQTLFPRVPFALIRGGLDGVPAKPHPATALEAAGACGAAPSECAFIGDSDVDMKTALAAGMLPVGAAWGFRGREELRSAGAAIIIDSITEALPLLSYDDRASR